MNGAMLQDRISRGLGTAARRVGVQTDAYRPRTPNDPLDQANRFLRLSAAFAPPGWTFARPKVYGDPVWSGIFDAAYTRPGDYLVQEAGTWFIAAQQALLPPLCIRTNCVVSLRRPSAPSGVGVNAYGGVLRNTATALLRGWPASVLTGSVSARPTAHLPGDSADSTWTVLLPLIEGVSPRSADLLTDDLGRAGVVAATDRSDLGWRLIVRQSST